MTQGTAPHKNISAIVAVCDDWGIGNKGDMLVRNKADMQHFVACTRNYTVIMGRCTLQSLPQGKPLPQRRNIVLSCSAHPDIPGIEWAKTIDEALERTDNNENLWVIGGGRVYHDMLPLCSRVVVTKNHCVRTADTFFPNLDNDPTWHVTSTISVNEKGIPLKTSEGIPFDYITYEQTGF